VQEPAAMWEQELVEVLEAEWGVAWVGPTAQEKASPTALVKELQKEVA